MRKKRLFVTSFIFMGLIVMVMIFRSAPPSPVYYLKTGREFLQSFFIFGNEDRTNWLLTLSEKRLIEAEQLATAKWDFLAKRQLDQAIKYQKEAQNLLVTLKDKVNTTYLEDRVNSNQEKIRKLQSVLVH